MPALAALAPDRLPDRPGRRRLRHPRPGGHRPGRDRPRSGRRHPPPPRAAGSHEDPGSASPAGRTRRGPISKSPCDNSPPGTRPGTGKGTNVRIGETVRGVTDPPEAGRRTADGFVPLIRDVPGLVAYHFADAGGGVMISMSVYEDQSGAEEASKRGGMGCREPRRADAEPARDHGRVSRRPLVETRNRARSSTGEPRVRQPRTPDRLGTAFAARSVRDPSRGRISDSSLSPVVSGAV